MKQKRGVKLNTERGVKKLENTKLYIRSFQNVFSLLESGKCESYETINRNKSLKRRQKRL